MRYLLFIAFTLVISSVKAQSEPISPIGDWILTTQTTIGERSQTISISQTEEGWLLRSNGVDFPLQIEQNTITWDIKLNSEQGGLSIAARGEKNDTNQYEGITISKSELFGSREAKWTLVKK